MEKKIFKFRDHIDFDAAYIVAHTEEQATKLMKEETELEVTMCDVRNIDDFPRANLNRPVPYIYKNSISPF